MTDKAWEVHLDYRRVYCKQTIWLQPHSGAVISVILVIAMLTFMLLKRIQLVVDIGVILEYTSIATTNGSHATVLTNTLL